MMKTTMTKTKKMMKTMKKKKVRKARKSMTFILLKEVILINMLKPMMMIIIRKTRYF